MIFLQGKLSHTEASESNSIFILWQNFETRRMIK